jgi:hypothetical protein
VGTFNFSAKYLSKKDSSTMLPELTEFVQATRMGIVRKVLLGLKNRAEFKRGFHKLFYLSSRGSIGFTQKTASIRHSII